MKWKHFPRYWPLRGIHRSPVNSPHKGQWRGALMFSLICAWINGSANNGEAGDLRRHRAHYDVTVMTKHRKTLGKYCGAYCIINTYLCNHDDFIKWKHFPRHWHFVLSRRPVTRSFDVFFDLRLNKRLSKQSKRRWFKTPSLSLWRECNEYQKNTSNCSQYYINVSVH